MGRLWHRKKVDLVFHVRREEIGGQIMGDFSEEKIKAFINGYTSADERFIRFAWNGKHAKEFVDENHDFRNAVHDAISLNLHETPLELIRDVFRAETQFSREAWCIDGRVGQLAEQLLRRGKDRFVEDFLEGKCQSFDASIGVDAFAIDLPLAERLLEVVRVSLRSETDKDRIELLQFGEETFQRWVTGCQQPSS